VGALAELGTYMLGTAGKVLGPLGGQAAGFLGDAALELLSAGRDRAADPLSQLDRRLGEVDRTIEEFHLARRKVLRDFQSRIDVLEGRLPSSRLSGED
jgi:hypothetical protein